MARHVVLKIISTLLRFFKPRIIEECKYDMVVQRAFLLGFKGKTSEGWPSASGGSLTRRFFDSSIRRVLHSSIRRFFDSSIFRFDDSSIRVDLRGDVRCESHRTAHTNVSHYPTRAVTH